MRCSSNEGDIIERMKKKASQNKYMTYRVVAIGFDKKGDIINIQMNKPRFNRKFGGLHAEELLMKNCGKNLKEIAILRVGRSGESRPIDPCQKCKKIAEKLGVKIRNI